MKHNYLKRKTLLACCAFTEAQEHIRIRWSCVLFFNLQDISHRPCTDQHTSYAYVRTEKLAVVSSSFYIFDADLIIKADLVLLRPCTACTYNSCIELALQQGGRFSLITKQLYGRIQWSPVSSIVLFLVSNDQPQIYKIKRRACLIRANNSR